MKIKHVDNRVVSKGDTLYCKVWTCDNCEVSDTTKIHYRLVRKRKKSSQIFSLPPMPLARVTTGTKSSKVVTHIFHCQQEIWYKPKLHMFTLQRHFVKNWQQIYLTTKYNRTCILYYLFLVYDNILIFRL